MASDGPARKADRGAACLSLDFVSRGRQRIGRVRTRAYTADIDVERAAKSFAARDRSENEVGPALPNQLTTASLGSTRLRIEC